MRYNNSGDNMNIVDIINKKRMNGILTKEEISYAVNGYVNDEIKDYQMSALLMAICLNGMNEEETFALTECMLHSGEIIDLSDIEGVKIDKHSTGGVGDKTTLILAPLVASCGVCVPKMSGRGLGHTGGTIDKLESIPNFNTHIDINRFVKQVKEIGVAIVGQMGNLVPADKKIYALRDVTGTVESIPLIASSIMSKKLASGADKILIDLKVGNGALIKNMDDAERLAHLMVKIGNNNGKETRCVITNMDQPLGNNIGNALEVMESMAVLKGEANNDLYELVIALATQMVSMGKNISEEQAKEQVIENIKNNKAYEKFLEMINYQEGDINKLTLAPKIFSVKSIKSGYINHINALRLGEIVRNIGGGRMTKEDKIDYGVGIILSKKDGDFVEKEEELLKIYLNQKDVAIRDLLECFTIEDTKKVSEPLIYKVIM